MASDKDVMLYSANQYAKTISAAKQACGNASHSLSSPIAEIADTWKGSSGTAMVNELEDLKKEFDRVYSRLSTLETRMRAHARNIYNNWPEDTDTDAWGGD